ncbi:hypothetical protein, partial [Gelidibacter salicanalis]|uniref:hypothetical protein n=1 Tax=Gelidibacter salicanalis TaxID=291193 RepID=UPI001F47B60A
MIKDTSAPVSGIADIDPAMTILDLSPASFTAINTSSVTALDHIYSSMEAKHHSFDTSENGSIDHVPVFAQLR